MAQDGIIQLARLALHEGVELSAIWREGAGLEYWLRNEKGVMLQINPQDALTLSNLMGFGDKSIRIFR